jgi:hypothetical protein
MALRAVIMCLVPVSSQAQRGKEEEEKGEWKSNKNWYVWVFLKWWTSKPLVSAKTTCLTQITTGSPNFRKPSYNQSKLGSNTSVIRTNRILRLDIDEGWYITSQYITKE